MPMHGSTYDVSANVHLRVKTNGSQSKRDLFDYLISRMDCDYPFAPEEISKHREVLPPQCGVCGGWFWRMPTLDREQLLQLAAQVNEYKRVPGHFKLKVKHFESEDQCDEVVVVGAAC